MPIPSGTKFHGVAPSVDTTDRGSATVQPLRDAYTIEDVRQTSAVPFFVTATPGGSLTYTDPANTIDVSWSGGAGTYTITMLSFSEIIVLPIPSLGFGVSGLSVGNSIVVGDGVNGTVVGGSVEVRVADGKVGIVEVSLGEDSVEGTRALLMM